MLWSIKRKASSNKKLLGLIFLNWKHIKYVICKYISIQKLAKKIKLVNDLRFSDELCLLVEKS